MIERGYCEKCGKLIRRCGGCETATASDPPGLTSYSLNLLGEKMADETWVVHIIGPDDVIEGPDELSALREANKINKEILKLAGDRNPNDPVILAVAVNTSGE